MASTNQTPHLGLSQWVLTDPFRMDDFNQDNAKIDAAVSAIPYEKLMDVTTSADAAQVDLNVSGIDFTKYAVVQLFGSSVCLMADGSSNAPTGAAINLKINGQSGNACTGSTSVNSDAAASYLYSASNDPINIRAEIFGFQIHPQAAARASYGLTLSVAASGGGPYRTTRSQTTVVLSDARSKMNTLSFSTASAGHKIAAGTKLVMYGVRI